MQKLTAGRNIDSIWGSTGYSTGRRYAAYVELHCICAYMPNGVFVQQSQPAKQKSQQHAVVKHKWAKYSSKMGSIYANVVTLHDWGCSMCRRQAQLHLQNSKAFFWDWGGTYVNMQSTPSKQHVVTLLGWAAVGVADMFRNEG
jgi:hypothetical protein